MQAAFYLQVLVSASLLSKTPIDYVLCHNKSVSVRAPFSTYWNSKILYTVCVYIYFICLYNYGVHYFTGKPTQSF